MSDRGDTKDGDEQDQAWAAALGVEVADLWDACQAFAVTIPELVERVRDGGVRRDEIPAALRRHRLTAAANVDGAARLRVPVERFLEMDTDDLRRRAAELDCFLGAPLGGPREQANDPVALEAAYRELLADPDQPRRLQPASRDVGWALNALSQGGFGGARVLEAGCGLSLLAHALGRAGYDVTALDVSRAAVAANAAATSDDLLRSNKTPSAHPNAPRFVVADWTDDAALPAASFDVIVCVDGLRASTKPAWRAAARGGAGVRARRRAWRSRAARQPQRDRHPRRGARRARGGGAHVPDRAHGVPHGAHDPPAVARPGATVRRRPVADRLTPPPCLRRDVLAPSDG